MIVGPRQRPPLRCPGAPQHPLVPRNAMSDDPRPVSGQQSDPRPAAGAPAWWAALGRPDLPLDSGATGPAESATDAGRAAPAAHTPAGPPRAKRLTRLRTVALNIVVLLVAVLIICVGVGVLSVSALLTTALLFGVPLTVAAVTATVVARRSR